MILDNSLLCFINRSMMMKKILKKIIFFSKNSYKKRNLSTMVEYELTPNPNAIKFLFPSKVIAEGKVTFTSQSQCVQVPLASAIFNIPTVIQLYFFDNFITVTTDGSQDWKSIQPKIEDTMNSFFDLHDIYFEKESQNTQKDYSNLSPELKEINEILDRTIRPGLQSDGGDLEILNLTEEMELFIHYEGACGSCPSATSGTLYAIEGILKDEFHPDIRVITA